MVTANTVVAMADGNVDVHIGLLHPLQGGN
jgi:hypothetical protein